MEYINSRAKFEIGQKVRVRDDLIVGKRYYSETSTVGNSFTQDMEVNKGKIAEVIAIRNGQYVLDIDKRHLYTFQMLHDLAVEDDIELVKSDYVFNKDVEKLLNKLMSEQVQEALDKALDERLFETNPEEFEKIASLLK